MGIPRRRVAAVQLRSSPPASRGRINTVDEEADELDGDDRATGRVRSAASRTIQRAGIESRSVMSTEGGHRLEDAPKFEPLISRLFGLC